MLTCKFFNSGKKKLPEPKSLTVDTVRMCEKRKSIKVTTYQLGQFMKFQGVLTFENLYGFCSGHLGKAHYYLLLLLQCFFITILQTRIGAPHHTFNTHT